MKKNYALLFFCAAFSFAGARAQDSTKPGVVKQLNNSSEKADNLHGKKIQQQTLTKTSFEKLDGPVVATKPAKKKPVK